MALTFEKQSMWNRLNGQPGNYYSQAAESEREEFRRFIKSILQDNSVLVEFTKADGTTRAMNCTLSTEFGAIYKMTETKNPVSATQTPRANDDICKVWDMDLRAWRSFRWDRLKKIQFEL